MPKKTSNTKNLEHAESIFKGIFDTSIDSIITIDEKGTVISLNPAAENLLGYTRKEVVDKNIKMVMPSPYKNEHDQYLENYRSTGLRKIIGIGREVEVQTKTGEIIPIHLSVSEAFIDDKRIFVGIARNISSLKKTQEELRLSEERSKAIIDNAVDSIITINAEGLIQSMNPSATKMFGVELDELKGQNVKALMPSPYKQEHDGYLQNYYNTKIKKVIGIGREVVGLRKDGSQFPIHLSVSEYWVNNERFFAGIVRDITDLKEAEEKIKINNEELSRQNWLRQGQVNLHESIKGDLELQEIASRIAREVSLYTKAQVGVFYIVENDKIKLYSGYSYPPQEQTEYAFNEGLIGRTAVEKRIIRLSDIVDKRLNLWTSFGTLSPMEIIAVPLLYDGQAIALLELGYSTNVDDTVIAFLESVIDSLGVSISSAISRTKIAELLEQTQKQASELQIQQTELKVSNEELQQKSHELEEQQRELEATNEELEEQRAALEEQKHKLEEANLDLVETRKDLEQKAKDLAISSKYKSEFLANMSHELRTPLNSILILSKLLMEDTEQSLSPEHKENAKIIYDSGRNLITLINDILDLSKVEAGKLEINIEEFLVSDLIDSLNSTFRAQIEQKGLKYLLEVSSNCPQYISSDILRLEQIIKNFISNAMKFTEQGEIKVFIQALNDEFLSIAVEDTGIGIPADKQRLIFEAFQQVDGTITRKYGGTGLGLSISRSLAEKLGAEIQVKSSEGQGSTFTLILPQKLKTISFTNTIENEPAIIKYQSKNAIDDRETIKAGDKTMLIFEADKVLAKAIAGHCRDLGYKCIVSTSGEHGLEDAVKFQPNSIIVDTDLPDQNGLLVLDRLKNNPQTRHIPTYIVSSEGKRSDMIKLGAVGMLNKNSELADIPEIIKRLERIYQKQSKKVLLIEDNKLESTSIKKLINDRSIEVDEADSGARAHELLKNEIYDCIILDLKLLDMSGFEFLQMIAQDDLKELPPIIVYTGKELSDEEQRLLEEISSSIVIKGVKSPERLLNEVTLFLHKLESEMSQDKQNILKSTRHREQIYEGKKVLIVDDDIRNVYSLKQILQGRGMELFMASTGKEALDKLAEHPGIDIVLMDIMMPEMNGFEAIETIRQTKDRKELPILALTAKAMTGDRDKCLSSGANDYLPKPIEPDRLMSLLRVWLSK